MKNELLDRVANTIREYDMRPMSGKILIALSGGADSVALTHMLIALSPRLKLELFAVHLNHNLRGEESARDERFVRDFCKRLSIPLTVYSEDIAAGAADSRRGIEEYARERRYALFGALAEETGAYLATAHHLNDVAETLIFNISRGCGIGGIASIAPKRGHVIRPLAAVSREEIERYLAQLGAEYVTDSTNLSDDYTRNKIRHTVIPALEALNPSFLCSVKRLTQSAAAAHDFIAEQARSLIGCDDCDTIAGLHDALLAEYIRCRCQKELGLVPDYAQTKTAAAVIRRKSGMAGLFGNQFLYISEGIILLGEPECSESAPFCVEWDMNGTQTPYAQYHFRRISKKEFDEQRKINNLLLKNALDYDKISSNLVMRSKTAGDKIRLAGRNCTKSLKKLFCEQKIPVSLRNRLGVLSNDKGEILWVELCGASEFAAPNDQTKTVLIIDY